MVIWCEDFVENGYNMKGIEQKSINWGRRPMAESCLFTWAWLSWSFGSYLERSQIGLRVWNRQSQLQQDSFFYGNTNYGDVRVVHDIYIVVDVAQMHLLMANVMHQVLTDQRKARPELSQKVLGMPSTEKQLAFQNLFIWEIKS